MSFQLQLYTRDRCHLCDTAKEHLNALRTEKIYYEEIDIDKDDYLTEKYGLMIPVVEYNGEVIQYGQIDQVTIKRFLKITN